MGTEDISKRLAKESGIEEGKEELLGVENMIKVVDLEREVRGLKEYIEEKDKKLNEKEKVIDEKDMKLIEKDKEIERLKARLKSK